MLIAKCSNCIIFCVLRHRTCGYNVAMKLKKKILYVKVKQNVQMNCHSTLIMIIIFIGTN